MKTKTLTALCKKRGGFHIYDQLNADGEVAGQWLGTVGAIFPLSGFPILTEDNIAALFDITEKQREKTLITQSPLPDTLSFADTDEDERIIDSNGITLNYSGRIVRPLITRDGLEFIDNEFLGPLADVADLLEIYERHTTSGNTALALKVGLMIVGVVMPLNIVEEGLVQNIEQLARNIRVALDLKLERERQAAAKRERERGGGQIKFEAEETSDGNQH